MKKLSDSWLFEQHSKTTVERWLKELRYFYFFRAWGGHANDGDMFKASIKFTDKQDLISKFGLLGIELNTIPPNSPKPIVGKRYSPTEYFAFKKATNLFEDIEQPVKSIINGYETNIWIFDYYFTISISGTEDNNFYEVSDADFEVCLEIEKVFDSLAWQDIKDTSIEISVCCISKNRYPEFYD